MVDAVPQLWPPLPEALPPAGGRCPAHTLPVPPVLGSVYQASQVVHKWDRGFLASPAMARVIRVERALGMLARPATRKKRARALRTLFTLKI